MKSSLLAQSSLPFSNRHLENAISMTEKQLPLKPYNSSDIVTDYFRNYTLTANTRLSIAHRSPFITKTPW
ncbi:unnamed protein product [Bursaphelenchus okinawaensis]|uniref:Uncharacterized protein n=1 Tax=Bursaphelenchus okinawaensis TaxID=465554 RepID=A0A811L0K7_9BILA|nr:unnamed protein product [Bursaphelenchus okinawaensis]CAG9114576.1 unnamed protein product [Bursaphelenchus okinawaensis]